MPFVNIRIYEGWGKDKLDQIASRVTDAIHEVTGLPKQAVSNCASGFGTPRNGTRCCLPGMPIVSVVPDLSTSTTLRSSGVVAAK